MKRSSGQSYVLTLKLNTNRHDCMVLDRRFACAWKMYNAMVRHARAAISGMRQDASYRSAMDEYRQITGTSPADKHHKAAVSERLKRIRLSYGLSEYGFHAWIALQQHRYKKHIDSLTAQKIATHVWQAAEKVIYGKGRTVHFRRLEEFLSVEGKNNVSGIRFRNGRLEWLGLCIQPQIRKGDGYARSALRDKAVKYCRIQRKAMGTSWHYYIQLLLPGIPPKKHSVTEGRVGIDPGTATEAIVSEKGCILTELASERPKILGRQEKLLQAMDRSRRATNPDNYNPDGTVKSGRQRRRWILSKRYRLNAMRLRTLQRRCADTVKQSEERLANRILDEHGSDIFTEKMDYKSMQARAPETRTDPDTGRYLSKRRFGRSLACHAPARFLTILDRKLGYIGKEVQYVDTTAFRASQYDHVTEIYTRTDLDVRWKDIGGNTVQRDLYSAFLLMNSAPGLTHPDRNSCISRFKTFLTNHDRCIAELINSNTTYPSSFGLI